MLHTKTLSLIAATFSAAALMLPAAAAPDMGRIRVAGQMTPAVTSAHLISRLAASTPLPLALTFHWQHPAELSTLIRRLHDPADPLYGQYLSTAEFTARFSPSQADYNAVAAFAKSQGLTVTATSPNRLVLNVTGPASRVETAFGVHLYRYAGSNGRPFYAANTNPSLPRALASKISSVIGLDNAAVWRCHSFAMPAQDAAQLSPHQIGSGPGGGLTPANIKAAYNLNGVSANGEGQVLGLFQLDGYTPSDIQNYQTTFGLPAVPLQNVLIDGASGQPGGGAIEVSLDIELQGAMAPNATKIMVYEGPNSGPGVIDTYNRIATDNLAEQISSSWGLCENYSNSAMLNAENAIFQQMAAQGQTIFAAAGDSGAYDNGSTLSVDDPASQPYVTGVGGTALSVNSDGSYSSETTWNHGSPSYGGGGGGISTVWPKPAYQSGLGVSATQRNVPDVSLDADPNTGYSIAYQGGWVLVGGTSCAAPLWAGFTALVNQERAANGLSTLGFANIPLYQIGQSAAYGGAFHDISDGSTNMKYSATAGYDDATGWGTYNGAGLLAALSGTDTTTPVSVPAAPASLTAVPANAKITLSWPSVTGASTYSIYRGTSSGGESSVPCKSGLTATTYADTSVVNGTHYFYTVAAVNSAGISPQSPEADAVPQAPVQLLSLTLSPATVGSGASSTGTITLANAAPSNGVSVALSSSNAVATVAATATVSAGAKTATFTITTQTVTGSTSATLSAAIGSSTKTATLTVQPILASFTVAPATVPGGSAGVGTLTLGMAAPTGGMIATLSSSDPSATVPATVTVPVGKTSITFPIKTIAVGANVPVTLMVTAGGQTRTAVVTVQAPTLTAVTLAPASLSGGGTSTGTVTLSNIAPSGGALLALTSSDPSTTVPATVTVLAGAKSATFSITTSSVNQSTSVIIAATYNGSKTATLTLQPVLLSGFTVSAHSVNGGNPVTGTVTLSSAAISGGAVVTLSSSNPNATVPASVTVVAGKISATFSITTTATGTGSLGQITATFGNQTKIEPLTVQPPAVATVVVTPTSVVGGSNAMGTVTLTSIAPSNGGAVSLYGGNNISVPATVTVAAGATTVTFPVTTSAVAASTPVTVYAAYNGIQKTVVTLLPVLASFTVAPGSVAGGGNVVGTLTLTAAAPVGGYTLALASSNAAVVIPATVTVPAGKTSVTVPVTTTPLAATAAVALSATAGSQTKTATLTVQAPAVASVTLTSSTVSGGGTVTGTVTLSSAAPDGGLTLTLTSSNLAVTVPATVTVAAGSETATFTVTTSAISATIGVAITAISSSPVSSKAITVLRVTH